MFAQLFLGIYFVVKGIIELYVRKPNLFLSESILQSISKENLSSYLNRVGKIHILLGIFIALMGQIEHWYNPELWIFSMAYIIVGSVCIGAVVFLNKKFSGNYRL